MAKSEDLPHVSCLAGPLSEKRRRTFWRSSRPSDSRPLRRGVFFHQFFLGKKNCHVEDPQMWSSNLYPIRVLDFPNDRLKPLILVCSDSQFIDCDQTIISEDIMNQQETTEGFWKLLKSSILGEVDDLCTYHYLLINMLTFRSCWSGLLTVY
jgi:hypothetical protein